MQQCKLCASWEVAFAAHKCCRQSASLYHSKHDAHLPWKLSNCHTVYHTTRHKIIPILFRQNCCSTKVLVNMKGFPLRQVSSKTPLPGERPCMQYMQKLRCRSSNWSKVPLSYVRCKQYCFLLRSHPHPARIRKDAMHVIMLNPSKIPKLGAPYLIYIECGQ